MIERAKINPAEVAKSKEAQLFGNALEMQNLTEEVYAQTRVKYPEVTANSRLCPGVTDELEKALARRDIKAQGMEHEAPWNRGSVSHAFVRVGNPRDLNPKWTVDFQYKQFVPEEKREELPDYMVFSYRTKGDVRNKLTEYAIPEKYHDYWVTELFWDSF